MLRRLVSPSVRRLFSSTADGVMSDFPGAAAPYTGEIQFVKGRDPMPVFRVLDRDGTLLSPKHDPKVSTWMRCFFCFVLSLLSLLGLFLLCFLVLFFSLFCLFCLNDSMTMSA